MVEVEVARLLVVHVDFKRAARYRGKESLPLVLVRLRGEQDVVGRSDVHVLLVVRVPFVLALTALLYRPTSSTAILGSFLGSMASGEIDSPKMPLSAYSVSPIARPSPSGITAASSMLFSFSLRITKSTAILTSSCTPRFHLQ